MHKLYQLLSIIIVPIILINTYLRIFKNKEDKTRFRERFGKPSVQRPKNKVIWIHATSVGEFKSIHTIIEAYHSKYSILVTTTTKSAADYAVKNYTNQIIHQYAPFDVTTWINKFIHYWKPELILWIESDLWPNTLSIIKKSKINCLLLNARISPKSYARWKLIKNYYNELLQTFSIIFAQSINDQQRLQKLSDKKIQYIGNLKLSNIQQNQKINFEKNNSLITIMFASTHVGEENQILILIKNLKNKYKNLKFYLAPRHPERAGDISKLYTQHNIENILESHLNKNQDTVIIDTFGKLPSYFNFSDIVFLGGSLTNNGGHNPIEPAMYNCAVITGNNVFNWQNIYDEMINENSCYLINNIEKLQEIIEVFINDRKKLNKYKKNASNFANNVFFDKKTLNQVINENLILNA